VCKIRALKQSVTPIYIYVGNVGPPYFVFEVSDVCTISNRALTYVLRLCAAYCRASIYLTREETRSCIRVSCCNDRFPVAEYSFPGKACQHHGRLD
jgi:hypothetical protein